MLRSGIWALGALALTVALVEVAPVSAQFYRGGRGWYGPGYYGPGYYGGWNRGSGFGVSIGFGSGYYGPRYYGSPYWGGYGYRSYSPGVLIGSAPAVSYYYSPPIVQYSTTPASTYSTPSVTYSDSTPSTSGVAPAAAEISGAAEATVEVHVPANAELSFDGEPTRQRGTDRTFVTPPLPTDRNASYQVRARWMGPDGMVEQTRRVEVRGGQRTVVDFTEAE